MGNARRPVNKGILLTGASGYIGGRLLGHLESRTHRLRCIARNPEFLKPRCRHDTEVVSADARETRGLREAVEGMQVAYYLVNSGAEPGSASDADRLAARRFAAAAKDSGLERIIYLSGLGNRENLSQHMIGQHEVGRILRGSGVRTIEFRSAPIIGSGSMTFEMIRSVVEVLPIVVAPGWMRSVVQPISVEDVVDYLVQALDIPLDDHKLYQIGGAEQTTLEGILREYARLRGLRRLIIPSFVSAPGLSSLWLTMFTPLHTNIARRIIDVVQEGGVVRDHSALRDFKLEPKSYGEAIARALASEDQILGATKWSVALSSSGPKRTFGGVKFGNRLVASETIDVKALPSSSFRPIEEIGGERGWYYGNWLWSLRGIIDQIAGGVGLRRGRRNPDHLVAGDPLDFFRVSRIDRPRFLQLEVEMKVPGRAWLQFEVDPVDDGSRIRLSAIFDPIGLLGLAYWYSMYPFHFLIFKGLLRSIAGRATTSEVGESVVPAASVKGSHFSPSFRKA